MKHENDRDTNCTVTKVLVYRLEDLEIRGRDETIQITALLRSAKILSPGNLRRLAVPRTPRRNHLLTLALKSLEIVKQLLLLLLFTH